MNTPVGCTVVDNHGDRKAFNADRLRSSINRLLEHTKMKTENYPASTSVDRLVEQVTSSLPNEIKKSTIYDFVGEECAFITDDPDYMLFAGQLVTQGIMSNITCHTFAEYIQNTYSMARDGEHNVPILHPDLVEITIKHKDRIHAAIHNERNFSYDFFAIRTLVNGQYLFNEKDGSGRVTSILETPQYMWMRVAIGIHKHDIDSAIELYHILSMKKATHATPTIFNAGTINPQLSSCFLTQIKDDSITGIFDTVKDCSIISKNAGGIGLNVNNVRSKGSHIKSTNGTSSGLVPMLKVFNSVANYVDQGGGKRKGSIAVYISPWHADILEWLDLKKNSGSDDMRARDLFYALWVSDLFMKRIIMAFNSLDSDSVLWSLFDPKSCSELNDTIGDAFELAYTRLEQEGKYVQQIPIMKLWKKIIHTQIETGTPYMLFKDTCNNKSNQKNLGIIKCSNLCAEIIQYSNKDEIANCNLASICLPRFVDTKRNVFDFKAMANTVGCIVRSLNRIIDNGMYVLSECKTSNQLHRPIGIGIQGLADVFALLNIPFDSAEARQINIDIAEQMYFSAMEASCDLAKKDGPYPSIYYGDHAPITKGIFHQDMCTGYDKTSSGLSLDWGALRESVIRYGIRNSLLIAHMPTASTSQIMGNTECFEPYFSNIFSRKTKSGEFFIINKHLVKELKAHSLWNQSIKDRIIEHGGSIQNIQEIPVLVQQRYKTIHDIPLKTLTLMARDRAYFVDQSMSLNVHFKNDANMFMAMSKYLTFAWKLGLKTGSYYTRSLMDQIAINFTSCSNNNVKGRSECITCSA